MGSLRKEMIYYGTLLCYVNRNLIFLFHAVVVNTICSSINSMYCLLKYIYKCKYLPTFIYEIDLMRCCLSKIL